MYTWLSYRQRVLITLFFLWQKHEVTRVWTRQHWASVHQADGCLATRPREDSKPRDSDLDFFNRSAILLEPRPQPCQDACQISERHDHYNIQTHGFEPSRHLPVRCLVYICPIYDDSSNGNIFRITRHLCGEFTGHQSVPHTKASDAELWCFLWPVPEYDVTVMNLWIAKSSVSVLYKTSLIEANSTGSPLMKAVARLIAC